MARLAYHALALGAAAAAGAWAAARWHLHPITVPLVAAPLYLAARAAARRAADALGRRLVRAAAALPKDDDRRLAGALDVLDRGHPDVARGALASLLGPGRPAAPVVFQALARACLRIVAHPGFAHADPAAWAGVTAGRRRPLPRLERALLAPSLPLDGDALAAECAVADDASLAAVLGTRRLLLATLLPAVGNPLHPFFPRAEQDLDLLLGARFALLPRLRLVLRARGLQPRRPLDPREEAAFLLLAWGREAAAAALLAGPDALGTLSRRGRALRSAAQVLLFLRDPGPMVVSPEAFARRTREIFFLHTRDFSMTHGAPHVDALPEGPRRLLDLLEEKRRLVRFLAASWARRPAMERTLGPLARRLAAGPDRPPPPRTAARFLRWWRTEGRRGDEACVYNLRGLLLMDEGRPAEAAGEFERALEIDPGLAPAAYNLAVALEEGTPGPGDPAARLRELAERTPSDPRARLLLGEFLVRAERPEEAERAFAAMLDDEPMDPDANLALGRMYLDMERPQDAEEPLRRALASRGDDPGILVALGGALLDGERPREAVPVLRAAVDGSDGDLREEARWYLHVALREAGDHPRAMEALEEVPDRFLRRHEDWLEEAALYLEERSRFERSSRLFEKLRELRARRGEL
jgi:tetratricopeptide (TPR) repeat protein